MITEKPGSEELRSVRLSRAEDGFTLIELLLVVIIIAILASMAIPTYLSTRRNAQDSAAITLVRNALTAVEGANIDYGDYRILDPASLSSIEPSIVWSLGSGPLVDPSVPTVTANITATADDRAVEFYPISATAFDIASKSESGNRFGIRVQTVGAAATDYIKVRVVDDAGVTGW